MRGRLIFPFLVEIAQLSTTKTRERDPDGPSGPLTSGYDDDFKEPVAVVQPTTATDSREAQVGEIVRVENRVQLPAQIEPRAFEQLQQFFSGGSPNAAIDLIFHFTDLEKAGFVDFRGEATLRLNDRLDKVFDCDGNLIQEFRDPPGLFATQVQPRGFGLGRQRNLLLMTFEEREQGTRQIT